jgi:hypothetical protein
MTTTTTTVKTWHTNPKYMKSADLTRPECLMFTNHDMSNLGWLEVGTAEITLTSCMTPEQVVVKMIDSLENEITNIQAEATKNITEIRQRINDLLMLPPVDQPQEQMPF